MAHVIYSDSAENTRTTVINRFGKKMKFNNGGYRIGIYDESEKKAVVHINRKCPDQFAGECYSVLKAVEYAKNEGLESIIIINDRIGSFDAVSRKKSKQGYVGAKYLYVAKKIQQENNISIEFDQCSSANNLADKYSRKEDSEIGVVFDAK